MKILYVNTKGDYSYKITTDGIINALEQISKEDPTIQYMVADHQRTEKHHIAPFIPDWVLTSTPLNNHSYVIKRYRGWVSVGWDLEGMYEWKRLRTTDAPNFDVIATVDRMSEELLRKEGYFTYYMPLAFDTNVYKYQEVPGEYKSDVVLAGVMYPSRAQIVADLVPICDRVKLRTINCKHWESKIIQYRSAITYYHGDKVPNDELIKYYCGSKIIIIGNRDFEHGNDQQDLYHSKAIGRVFQETATRRCVFVDNKRPNVSEHFEVGKEIIMFNNGEELREKVLYYLSHEEERESIAHNGYVRTMKENQYVHRMRGLIEYMRNNLEMIQQKKRLESC